MYRTYPVGTVTDSSVFTYYLLTSVTENSGYNKKDVLNKYLYMANIHPMIDSHSRKVFNFKTIEGYNNTTKISKNKLNNTSYSSLSRCSILSYKISNEDIITDTKLSHSNNLNIHSSIMYKQSLRYAIEGKHKRFNVQ